MSAPAQASQETSAENQIFIDDKHADPQNRANFLHNLAFNMSFVMWCRAALAAVVLSVVPHAFAITLNAPGGGNSNYGLYFDATAVNDLTITNIQAEALEPGDFELWTRSGTHVGFTGSSAGWTLIGTVNVPAAGAFSFPINSWIPAGGRRAFFIIAPSSKRFVYQTSGGGAGTPAESDANLQLYVGGGTGAKFAGGYINGRKFVGNITYGLGFLSTTTASVPTLSEWGLILMSALLAAFGLSRMRKC